MTSNTPQNTQTTPRPRGLDSARPQGASQGPQGPWYSLALNSSTQVQNAEKRSEIGDLARRLNMLDTACSLVHNPQVDGLPMLERMKALQRIEHCTRRLVAHAGAAELRINPKAHTNSFSKVQLCDLWACPNCSVFKAQEEKRRLQVGMLEAQRQGLYPLMITITMRHKRGDLLDELLGKLYAAKDSLLSGRFFIGLKERYGIAGHNRYTECTTGPNGWHAHMHLLFFCRWEFTEKETQALQLELAPRWLKMLAKHGAAVPTGATAKRLIGEGRPLHVEAGDSKVVEYMAKMGKLPQREEWGLEHELSSAVAKKGRREGFTPFELLALATGDPEARAEAFAVAFNIPAESVAWLAGDLWLEYYRATQGRRMIDWGKGLLKLLKVEEQLEALQEQQPDEGITVLHLVDYVQLRSNKALYLQVRAAGDAVATVLMLLDSHGLYYELEKKGGGNVQSS